MKIQYIVGSLIGLFAFSMAVSATAAEFHHLHLTVTDTAQAADWYAKYFDGQKGKFGNMDMVTFGKTSMLFIKKPAGFAGSVGSAIDHFGWYFPDLAAKMKEFEAAGVKIVQPLPPTGMKQAFIEDPWGTKIELLQNENAGLNHVHLMAADPDAMLKWFHDAFGGQMGSLKIGNNSVPNLTFGSLMVMVRKADAPAPTTGRSFDHIGFSVPDLDAEAKRLKELGVKFTMEPRSFGTSKIDFVESPGGVSVEIVQVSPQQ